MADLGSIAQKGGKGTLGALSPTGPQDFRRIVGVPGPDLFRGLAKDTTDGSPAQPCLQFTQRGRYRFRWPVAAGTRTLTIDCKYAPNEAPRPTVTIRKNVEIGVNADVVGTAGAGTGWVTIGPLSITPSDKGGVWVELDATHPGNTFAARWDNLRTT